jgi:hypothetical protein
LLPTNDWNGLKIPTSKMRSLARELTERFGGVTTYLRAPAEGTWQPAGAERVEKDDIVIFEVMADDLDPLYWGSLRAQLEAELQQSEIVVRGQPIDIL